MSEPSELLALPSRRNVAGPLLTYARSLYFLFGATAVTGRLKSTVLRRDKPDGFLRGPVRSGRGRRKLHRTEVIYYKQLRPRIGSERIVFAVARPHTRTHAPVLARHAHAHARREYTRERERSAAAEGNRTAGRVGRGSLIFGQVDAAAAATAVYTGYAQTPLRVRLSIIVTIIYPLAVLQCRVYFKYTHGSP